MAAEPSVFQTKYNEFVSDLLGALPEYTAAIQDASQLDSAARISQFQEEVKVANTLGSEDDMKRNPGTILPGVTIADSVWKTLSDTSKRAIWEHVRVLSICCFMEAGFGSGDQKPAWMEEAMDEMKKKLESVDFASIIKKFMNFFQPSDGSNASAGASSGPDIPGMKGIFENGFPKLPERFLKGHMA
jgi:hypothetical protein